MGLRTGESCEVKTWQGYIGQLLFPVSSLRLFKDLIESNQKKWSASWGIPTVEKDEVHSLTVRQQTGAMGETKNYTAYFVQGTHPFSLVNWNCFLEHLCNASLHVPLNPHLLRNLWHHTLVRSHALQQLNLST